MEPTNNYTKEQADILEEFKQKAQGYGFEFFALVGDPKTGTGASVFGTTPETPEDNAARNARKAHMEWEVQHHVDPYHSR